MEEASVARRVASRAFARLLADARVVGITFYVVAGAGRMAAVLPAASRIASSSCSSAAVRPINPPPPAVAYCKTVRKLAERDAESMDGGGSASATCPEAAAGGLFGSGAISRARARVGLSAAAGVRPSADAGALDGAPAGAAAGVAAYVC